MTLSVGQSIAIIAVCAACTFLERWLPWLLFGHRAVPKVVEYLGKILPMAVMVSLLVYCLRGMQFTAAGAWVPQVIAVGVTAGLHWWRRNTLLSIAAGVVVLGLGWFLVVHKHIYRGESAQVQKEVEQPEDVEEVLHPAK